MYDHWQRNNWYYPRTSREAFGVEHEPLRKSFSFLPKTTGGFGLAVGICFLLLAFLGCAS